MKQIEKLDLILKALYEIRLEGYYPLAEICLEKKFPIELKTELRRLAKRLESDGYIDIIYAHEECFGQITETGIVYSKMDSYSRKGQSVISNQYDSIRV